MDIKKPINKSNSILDDNKSIRIDKVLDTMGNNSTYNHEEFEKIHYRIKAIQYISMISKKIGYIVDDDVSKLDGYITSKYNVADYRTLPYEQLIEILSHLQHQHKEIYGNIFKETNKQNGHFFNFIKDLYNVMVTKLNIVISAIGLHKWHYGKIIVLWVIATLMLLLMSSLHLLNEVTVWIWIVYFVIVIIMTWRWLSSRETKRNE